MPVPQYYTETPAISVEWYDESFHTSNTTNIYVSCQSISKRRNAAWEYLSVLISSPFLSRGAHAFFWRWFRRPTDILLQTTQIHMKLTIHTTCTKAGMQPSRYASELEHFDSWICMVTWLTKMESNGNSNGAGGYNCFDVRSSGYWKLLILWIDEWVFKN